MMDNQNHAVLLKERMLQDYQSHLGSLTKNSSEYIRQLKGKAIGLFKEKGFPSPKAEDWRFTDLSSILSHDFQFNFENKSKPFDISTIFRCEVYDLDTFSVALLNGWYVYKHAPLAKMPDGTIIGSLAKAMEVYPELVDKYFGKSANMESNQLLALNTAFSQDGIFIYVPDNVKVDKAIQAISLVDEQYPSFVQPRNLIVLGKNSSLTYVHCEHSLTHSVNLNNCTTEFYLEEDAQLEHYVIQNKGKNSALINNTSFALQARSVVKSNTITLNGGFTRNNISAQMLGPNADCDLKGLYLVDRVQHVDNHVFVDHISPQCSSNQLFKGILDDEARAVFSGKILVRKDAQQTNAFQSNRNILLTDDARINTKPFLEIYADDVKCSHGATVGQLDPEAMFYLRSRGLCERSARQLLMYAFAAEVVNQISIEPLRERINGLVDKRLKGELSICDQCVLHCNSKEPTAFDIDMSKI